MDAEQLVELMQGYLMQDGYMESFLNYCEEDLDMDSDEVESAIDGIVYGG